MKNVQNKENAASSSRLPRNNVTRESAVMGEAEPSELHAADLSATPIGTFPATPVAAASATSFSNATISRVGYRTRSIRCPSAQDTNGHP